MLQSKKALKLPINSDLFEEDTDLSAFHYFFVNKTLFCNT